MRVLRILMTVTCAVGLVPLAAGAARAAAPANDEYPGALVLSLGDTATQDTSGATTTTDDAALNLGCGAPATSASVWYQYSPSTDGKVALDTTASDYSAGVMAFQGTPSVDSLVACGPVAVGLHAQAGATYYIMAFSDTEVNGGNLVLSLKNAPTPAVHVSLAKRGVAFHGGAATIHGTYSCRHADQFAGVNARLLQRAGRLKIQAEAGVTSRCDGLRHTWSVRLVSPVGTYARGRAVAKAVLFGCGVLECNSAVAKRRIHLAWARGLNRGWVAGPTSALRVPRPTVSHQARWPSSSW